jgi:hypothetical protein
MGPGLRFAHPGMGVLEILEFEFAALLPARQQRSAE